MMEGGDSSVIDQAREEEEQTVSSITTYLVSIGSFSY